MIGSTKTIGFVCIKPAMFEVIQIKSLTNSVHNSDKQF